jgi:hypothetical protein
MRTHSAPPQGCCSATNAACSACVGGAVTRRGFFALSAAPAVLGSAARAKDPDPPSLIKVSLRVQPVFIHEHKQPKPAASWRWTAEIYSEQVAVEECARIQRDLAELQKQAGFPIEVLPLQTVHNREQAGAVAQGSYDALVMYAASRQPEVMEVLARPDRWNLVFVRHRSGPIYYMYVGIHGHFFRKRGDEISQPAVGIEDVVVDNHQDLLWRLRALYGLKNTIGKRIVSIGEPGGWGNDGGRAPERARARWKLDIVTFSYADLERKIKAARADAALVKLCDQKARDFMRDPSVSLETQPDFVSKAFLLTEVFRDVLRETNTDAITVQGCMQTIMPISETTACLPLSMLNDEGYLAFCESDFVTIPSGLLLHYISGKPVFMANASFPYNGIVTISHCTAPRRMDGVNLERARILTHYESDFGAAPKVEMRKGQQVTVLNPDFAGRRWLGFRGEIMDSPFFPICRSQAEIGIQGSTATLAREIKGWHWLAGYGSHLRETGYALAKNGVGWLEIV